MPSRLPPLNALRAFEAAARHGGYNGAANELHVTRGAISRHVKLLEDHLGLALFQRKAQGVALTSAGASLQPVLADAFNAIAREVDRITADAGDLRIICPPGASIRWVIPRLDDFHARHPDIRVRLTTDFVGTDGFDPIAYDLAFTVEHWPRTLTEIETERLCPTRITPLCAPKLLHGDLPLKRPQDLAHHTLLHETPSRIDWRDWLTGFNVTGVDAASGPAFPNFDMSTRAAVLGTGVVMGDIVLNREEIEAGLLVAPFPDMVLDSHYGWMCLLGARDKWHDPKVVQFRAWAVEQGAEDCARLGVSSEPTS